MGWHLPALQMLQSHRRPLWLPVTLKDEAPLILGGTGTMGLTLPSVQLCVGRSPLPCRGSPASPASSIIPRTRSGVILTTEGCGYRSTKHLTPITNQERVTSPFPLLFLSFLSACCWALPRKDAKPKSRLHQGKENPAGRATAISTSRAGKGSALLCWYQSSREQHCPGSRLASEFHTWGISLNIDDSRALKKIWFSLKSPSPFGRCLNLFLLVIKSKPIGNCITRPKFASKRAK